MTSKFLELKGFLSFLILHEVSKKSLCGEDLAKKIGRRKASEPLTPGTIYPALKLLRKEKIITFEQFGRKKIYSLTEKGRQELGALYEEFSAYFYGLKSYIKRPKKTKQAKLKTLSKN